MPGVEAVEAAEANPASLRGVTRKGDERMISSHEGKVGPELKPESTEGGCRVNVLRRPMGAPLNLG